MYLDHWGLTKRPFATVGGAEFFFRARSNEMALMKLTYLIDQKLGAGLLWGPFGCGKTFLVEWLLANLPSEQYRTVLIRNPQIDSDNLLLAMARQLGGANLPVRKTELLTSVVFESLEDALLLNHRNRLSTVVVVDEAHLMIDPKVMETLRLVLNMHASGEFLITLILAGQPDLKTNVENIRQLEQRIAVKCSLSPLTEKESGAYIDHRLKRAGASKEIFTPAAKKSIFEHSGGLARRINRACDLCLVVGFGLSAQVVDEKVVSIVIDDVEGKQ